MKLLSDLLKNHPIPGIREAEKRRVCAETLSRVTGVTILPKQIRYSDFVISLSVPPILKSAIQLKFEEAKNELEREGIEVTAIR